MDAGKHANGGSVDQLDDLAIEIEAGAIDLAPTARASADASKIEKRWQDWLPAVAPNAFSADFEWFHADFWNWYWPLLQLRRAGLDVPDEMPLDCFLPWGRGLAKSSSMEGVALAEGAMIGEAFGVYISSTKDKAEEHLQAIRDLIEGSQIDKYYPGLANPRFGKFGNKRGWRADAIYTKGGFAIVSCSLEQGLRGLKDGARRPTFILLDDIDERDDSPETKAEKFESITQDALHLLAPYGLTIFGQNLIYNGSIAHDTLQRKMDWLHHCHIVGVRDGVRWKPINTFQDDLKVEKVNGRPTVVTGTANWSRLDRRASQRMLEKAGERAFWRECQNKTAPDPEELVWKTYSAQHSVITWDHFAKVFGSRRIRADFNLYAGYDKGNTGPEKHPGVFSVAAVAPRRSPLAGDVFIFYEYVAEATEDVGDMAKHLIEDLVLLCEHPAIREAARLLEKSYAPGTPEDAAWKLRKMAGRLIPFKVFNGSHEALEQRRTLQTKWGFPVQPGDSAKDAGLEQLHHYAKLEAAPHPFFSELHGRPNLYLVVAPDQYEVAENRFGLHRHRWEAENLKWDKNITTRDVPEKFGDDATDGTKFYMQTFSLIPKPLTMEEKIQAELPDKHKLANLQKQYPDGLPQHVELGYIINRQMAERRVKIKGKVKRFNDRLKLIK